MTLSEDKICIASSSTSKKILYLIILNLFNDDTKMLIQYYSINLSEKNFMIYENIKLYLYNNFITFGFSHYNTGDSSKYYSSLIIFSYPIIEDPDTNLELNCNDIASLNIQLSQNYLIQNNIFGYQFLGNQIVSISDNLYLYYKNNETTILDNYIIESSDIIN
jgi:hypothetical protein